MNDGILEIVAAALGLEIIDETENCGVDDIIEMNKKLAESCLN